MSPLILSRGRVNTDSGVVFEDDRLGSGLNGKSGQLLAFATARLMLGHLPSVRKRIWESNENHHKADYPHRS